MNLRGDSQRQAFLRDQRIKKTKKTHRSLYVSQIFSALKPQTKLLDIGCGTGHIIQELAENCVKSIFVGLDVSSAMIETAKTNTELFHNIELVEGDGLKLPFPENTFDIIIARLADYSHTEAYRVLKTKGYFFEYSLGPDADKEIKEFFHERIEKENFFIPENVEKWKQEVSRDVIKVGFTITDVSDFRETNYYGNEEELMDLIEMVPLVRDFDREKDRMKINELAEKYGGKNGIEITWHYYILIARK